MIVEVFVATSARQVGGSVYEVKEKAMKRLFAVTMVALLMLAAWVPGVSAIEICSTESVSCVSVTAPRYRGMGDLAVAETKAKAAASVAIEAAALQRANDYTLMAADYFAAEAAALRRANEAYAARYTGMAGDYFGRLALDARTLSSARGIAGLRDR